MKVTTYLHLVPKLMTSAAITPLFHIPSRHAQGQLDKGIMHVPCNMTMLYAFYWVIPQHLNFICQRFRTLCLFHLHRWVGTYQPMKMEQTECSETLAYEIQMPGNYPIESTQHSEHGESLKSSMAMLCSTLLICRY